MGDHRNDDVFPLHMLDDTKVHRAAFLTLTLRFNDVLDSQKLYTGLGELLELGNWRKLGGRLRLRHDNRLEIHVPRPCTAERPLCAFSCDDAGESSDQYSLAKDLSKATDEVSVQRDPDDFCAFVAPEGALINLQDYLQHDTPMLSLHVTLFADATLVAISWPHVLMDVVGQQAFFKSWALVMAGQKSEVPPLLDAEKDMMIAAADAAKDYLEDFEMGQSKLTGFNLL